MRGMGMCFYSRNKNTFGPNKTGNVPIAGTLSNLAEGQGFTILAARESRAPAEASAPKCYERATGAFV